MVNATKRAHDLVVIGGGPGGYEAALTGAQLGANVTLIEQSAMGGSAVLTDVVPSKTLIATGVVAQQVSEATRLGIGFCGEDGDTAQAKIDLAEINARLMALAHQQSDDMLRQLEAAGVRYISGRGTLLGHHEVEALEPNGHRSSFHAHTTVLAVGASPRTLSSAQPDGERILTWKQLYSLRELPEHLIVVGSGVTGAEFANAYRQLGSEVTLISSRERVLPGEDDDAAAAIQDVFQRSGMTLLSKSRAESVVRKGDTVVATLSDGRTVVGSHCLMAVGSVPNTAALGLVNNRVETNATGHIVVNRVACTSIPEIYAVGDCSAFVPLASVATMQGRTAVFHALGDEARPIKRPNIAANVFTQPEIATVGISQQEAEAVGARVAKIDLALYARAKMMGIDEGFVKVFARGQSGTVLGAVIVAPQASELIYPLSIAVRNRLTVDQLAESFTVFPSLTGILADAASQLHPFDVLDQ